MNLSYQKFDCLQDIIFFLIQDRKFQCFELNQHKYLTTISFRILSYQKLVHNDDGDEWLEQEIGDLGNTSVPIADDEDVSFSDLEEDDGAA